MLRPALRRAASAALSSNPILSSSPTPAAARFYAAQHSNHHQVARQMIQYALGLARSQKSAESYDQAMLVLEQGVSNLRGTADDSSGDDAAGILMLAISTLHYERGGIQDAMDTLDTARGLPHASLPVKVAAWEGLAGLELERGQETIASPNEINNLEDGAPALDVHRARVRAIKGLADLVNGQLPDSNTRSMEMFITGQEYDDEDKFQMGKSALFHGECLHCAGNLPFAKGLYEKALELSEIKDNCHVSCFAATNMAPQEVLLGATCALGQLLSHSGNFHDAEELLTKALKMAEDHFGPSHPKVGVILTCIALMFKHKAKLESSSSILIQEGLYRKAMELLKAPSLDVEASSVVMDGRDIVALARGGYSDLLRIQQNRKDEGERMRKWAEGIWRNRRLSLAEALEFSEPSKAAVVDTRICRVL